MDNGGFNFGDIECGRSYPLQLNGATVALELAQIPGYATSNAAAQRAFDAAPLGTTWTMLSSGIGGTTLILPIGSTFRKLNRQTWANGGRVTRIGTVGDVIALTSTDDSFITSLTVTGPGGNAALITGITLNGAGALVTGAPVKAWVGGIAAQTCVATAPTGTLQYTAANQAAAGCEAILLSDAGLGTFSFAFTFTGPGGPIPVVVEYRGVIRSTTVVVA